ncbi:SH3 domain-containing protein [Fulvimarina sp. 2208YS6-2-32]|uniref:SH3 domain-containing protein n=1 Tax=Fulvimarina uroteuthidis TaxID=3098149 RepID=A0ABU5HXW1_9HYPH|nr:SH3 domain-containing protein [Fulvimarina sp. 2208YS6-2-32]MDY8107712.1 SH3 domain-containing protein [Fulvimarina sp. 2208YS6-2-32]
MPRHPLAKAGSASLKLALGAAMVASSLLALPSLGAASELGRYSKLPLPRYVSLKSGRVNLRNGPGREHKVNWLYLKSGLPVEVVQEFDHWRKIRDSDGTEGWVYHSLLSGERTAIAAPWLKGKETYIDVFASPAKDAGLVARMEPGVVSKVETCRSGWCQVAVANREGYVEQREIWGVYPDETME